MIAPSDGSPLVHFEGTLDLIQKLRQQIEGDPNLDQVQLRKLDAAAMALLVAINMKRQRSMAPTAGIKPLPDQK
ncbi:MAG: hypothetical protein JNM45_00355 [Rhizobiales bacterium]|nr:hypothetical protein [Hyphomicrobiales bacterium]